MRKLPWLLILLSCARSIAEPKKPEAKVEVGKPEAVKPDPVKPDELKPEEQTTKGAVTIGGRRFDYTAVAGTLLVKAKEPEDAPEGDDKKPEQPAVALMSYAAYFAGDATRPITFLYNGGPGSATLWLHMGAFGPRRVVTADAAHTTVAPYQLVDNAYSLLDASDLVFIDAPATGFGKIAGKDKEKAFFGVDADADAFAGFITQFLTKYGRWNAPKYLFGESYGTVRSAALAYVLETQKQIDLAGVISLSQILSFDASPDGPAENPGVDLPYQLALPTYAATAWYHKKLPDVPASLSALLVEVEQFAMGDYAAALAAGNTLDATRRKTIVDKLHHYTGLPVAYIDRANLRISGGMFEKMVQDDADLTTGRLDSRFSGPNMDPLSKEIDYDPQQAALAGAYVAAYNEYVRKQLKFGGEKIYKPSTDLWKHWNLMNKRPGSDDQPERTANVMPNLAAAMKYNPNLRVQLEAGYYDIATPFYEGVFELQHLPIPPKLQSNISMKFYESGHMIYAHEPSLKLLHDNVAAFIRAAK